jgi:hypothetical protein
MPRPRTVQARCRQPVARLRLIAGRVSQPSRYHPNKASTSARAGMLGWAPTRVTQTAAVAAA